MAPNARSASGFDIGIKDGIYVGNAGHSPSAVYTHPAMLYAGLIDARKCMASRPCAPVFRAPNKEAAVVAMRPAIEERLGAASATFTAPTPRAR
ncbi:hypothetical protein MTO96_023354 [Rhipicephalus appendiculatus]